MNVKSFLNVAIAMLCVSMIALVGCKKDNKKDEPIVYSYEFTSFGISVMKNDAYAEAKISWDGSGNATVSIFQVYRNGVSIANVASGVKTYLDQNLEAGEYTYYVVAVHNGGTSKSIEFPVTITGYQGEDYADIVKGDYLGDIIVPISETNIDTIPNVTISLNYKSVNKVAIYMDATLSVAGMNVPILIDKEIDITKNGESYVFAFETTTNVSGFPLPIPLNITGTVTGNNLIVNVMVNAGIATIPVVFTGTKQ